MKAWKCDITLKMQIDVMVGTDHYSSQKEFSSQGSGSRKRRVPRKPKSLPRPRPPQRSESYLPRWKRLPIS